MKINEENVIWALTKLQILESLPGYPKTEAGIEGVAKGLLRLVHNQSVSQILASTGSKPIEGSPDVNDVDWLMDEIIDHYDRFPTVAEMRGLYTQHWPPAEER